MSTNEVRLIAVPFTDEIVPGDNVFLKLAAALRHQNLTLQENDIVVIKHKVISKGEGEIVQLTAVRPRRSAVAWARKYHGDARVFELALSEAKRIVRKKNGVLITETRHGFVCANTGVDASNVSGGDSAVLLPKEPDRSAARLRSQVKKAFRISIAVIVSDSFGRPWREGLTDVAIGVAGLKPLADFRGKRDSHGYMLRGTVEAVADELACAAGLVCGKLNRTPVCVIRGFKYAPGKGTARDLVRKKNDLFR